ncbi:CBS domain-containing protein, partial [Streptomyces sp. NPDC001833]|uniref:CBS domain-containing protein n=1 Tax=Streptomyces sp. NPDC001833 TaxID=3154658 RepID=UPI00332D1AC9
PPIRLRLIRDGALICEVSDSNSTAPHLRRARTYDDGGRVPVRRVMTPSPVTVPATANLSDFLAEGPFGRYRHAAFPVLAADGSVTGLLTVRRVEAVPPQARAHTTARDAMLPLGDVMTVAPDEPVLDLLPRLQESPVRRVLVLDQGRLVGILTVADVTRALTWPTPPQGRGASASLP